jgi:Na+/melibiose symporter-like transporter
VIALFSSLTYSIIEAPSAGWLSAQSLGLFGFALLALVLLLAYEPRRREPLLELRFFRSVPFSSASAIAVCAFAALGGFLFLNTLYLQEVRGLSAVQAGLCTLPIAAMTLIFAPLSGRIVGSRGPRLGLLVGGAGIALGSALLTGLGAHTSIPSLVPAYLIFGIGFGMVNPPITNTAVLGMPPAQAGVAAAVASTSRQLGQTLGVAIVGAVTAAGAVSVGPGFVQASHTGWWITTGCGLAVFALGLASTTRRADISARRVAEELDESEGAATSEAQLVGV